jgi:hypothetical protein
MGDERANLFAERFAVQRAQPDFTLVEEQTWSASASASPLSHPLWWQHVRRPLPEDMITDRSRQYLVISAGARVPVSLEPGRALISVRLRPVALFIKNRTFRP